MDNELTDEQLVDLALVIVEQTNELLGVIDEIEGVIQE